MRVLRFDVLVFSGLFAFLASPAPGQTPATPAQASAPAAQQTQSAPPSQRPAVPDYPDPRTFTLGVFYWVTGPGTNPALLTGRQALDFETLSDLGKVHSSTPGIEVSFPISRTGSLHFEGFRARGTGNQIAPDTTDLFGTQFNEGDLLATQYKLTSVKFYLDDLLFPHKFPVAKFRLKSLWEVQYVKVSSSIDAPLVTGETAFGSQQLVLPTFGLAAEYAVARHVLLRVAGSGFGLSGRSNIWDGEATISFRKGQWEVIAGEKAFHFRTSPNNVEYMEATMLGAFGGLRWHWSL